MFDGSLKGLDPMEHGSRQDQIARFELYFPEVLRPGQLHG